MQKLLFKIITLVFISFFTILLIIDLRTNANTNQNRQDTGSINKLNESLEKPVNNSEDINNYIETEVYDRKPNE